MLHNNQKLIDIKHQEIDDNIKLLKTTSKFKTETHT